MFLGCRISKIVADPSDFPPLTCSSLQQEMPEEEEAQLALVQVALEKQAAQHGPLLRRNVEDVKWRLHVTVPETWPDAVRLQCHESFKDFLKPSYFYCLCFFRKLWIENVRLCENRVRFTHGRTFFNSRNVQKRATKSDTSGPCLLFWTRSRRVWQAALVSRA